MPSLADAVPERLLLRLDWIDLLRAKLRDRDDPQRTLLLVVVIVLMTTLAAVAMLPNTEEKAQVLISQGRISDAIALYEAKRVTTRLNPFEIYSLAGLYEAKGSAPQLVRLLEDELALRPESDWARPKLVAIYHAARAYADEARILHQTFALDPGPEAYRRLTALYRLTGDRAGERLAIERAAAHGLASAADLERLDYLASPRAGVSGPAEWRADSRTTILPEI